MNKVVIGIQARSTSKRFPNKVFERIGGKEMLRHVLDAANNSIYYINKNSHITSLNASVAVVCPVGDPIKKRYKPFVAVVEGPEDDVLTRYMKLLQTYNADFIVRITADCPLIPKFLISKMIKTAVINRYDYFSNVDERFRSTLDGYDIEVISSAALKWADKNATDPRDREHVTTIIRTDKFTSSGFTQGFVTNYLNQSQVKLSVDTPEDLERVRAEYDRIYRSTEKAREYFGRMNVHQI